MNRLKWLVGVACLVSGQAVASPIGFASEVFYEYPGDFGRVEGASSVVLPDLSFTVPDIGSGAFGGSAAASYLSLSTAVYSTATSSNPCCSNGATARAIAVAQDILTPGGGLFVPGQPGFLSLGFAISGKNLATVINPGPLATSARAAVNVQTGPVVVNANPVNTTGPNPGQTLHAAFTALEYSGSAFTMNFPIHIGVPIVLWIQLLSVAEGSVTDGGLYTATSSFGSTLVLDSVRILDSAMQPVSNPSLVSASGTAYPLVGGSSTVPEPASLALIGLGLFAVAGRRLSHKGC